MKVHQIWQGDSVELCQRFKEGSVDCIITDPPFGVDNMSNMAVTEAGKKYATKIANDESPEVAIKVFKDVMSVLLPKTKEHSDLYVFTSYQVLSDWLVMLDEFAPQFGFNRKAVLVWEKDGPGMGDLESWGQGHEFILYFKKGRAPRYAKRRNGVLHIPQLRPNQLIHPHEKPTALLELLIKHSTKEGAFLVDPFGGSGSLVRAARNCGRNAVAIELDPARYEASARKLESEGDDLFADL
ncbi:DNA methyltransferase [Gordonia phage Jams]|uniref:DNA methylase n=3 Tax=Woesvirus woes TaxID=1982751 RepID=A0A482JIE9_9CAUD|nr:DNA methylase [Gordonia phage Nimi13]QDF16905.1 DNA methylase [Gordonia phage Teal]QDH48691.1 DNA methylase [Gordonia phage Newt]UVK60284.1 DNA methyltransferase [Gordonia phage Shelley]UVK60774.1 DNA methyltransferase [Gordonia phage Bianmat]UVK61752.1 DNA methyltransferase [Gordonia phage MrWormie]UVK62773.1 DNA methyltransferase [Gordonia phage Lidong]UXE04928.1 DNA methyltransferase [Gordonia phage Jams]UYL87217.1 DNA methyltransferase [Gordonia phage Minos]